MPRITRLSKPSFLSISLTLIFLWPSLLVAQVEEKETLFYLSISAECASLEDDAYLSDAITDRIPNAFIIRNKSVVPDWSIFWEKPEDGAFCVLTIFRGTTHSTLPIGPKAKEKEIDAAASRIVWISSFSKDEPIDKEKKVEEKVERKPIEEKKAPLEKIPDEKMLTPPSPITNLHNSKLTYDHVDFSLSLIPGIEFYSNKAPHYRGVPAFSFNVLGGSHIGLKGVEIGTFWNHKSEFVDGFQLALGANISDGPLDGVQIALVNIANQNSKGLQLGLTNFADDLNGLQIGLFNFGARTDVQIGIINIAEKNDFSLGIFNLNWAYPLRPVVWFASDTLLTLGVQHGGEHIKYSLLAGVYLPEDAIQVGGGFGYHTNGKYFLTGDLFAFQILFLGDSIWQLSLNLQAKVSLGYRFSERFALFVGASMNGMISTLSGAARVFPNAEVIDLDASRSLYLWPNLHAGMSF